MDAWFIHQSFKWSKGSLEIPCRENECLDHQHRPAVAVSSFTIKCISSESEDDKETVKKNAYRQKCELMDGLVVPLVGDCLFLICPYLLYYNQYVFTGTNYGFTICCVVLSASEKCISAILPHRPFRNQPCVAHTYTAAFQELHQDLIFSSMQDNGQHRRFSLTH